eukprot:7943160-Lingulodinium_polyedra.AAC.1
MYTSWVSPRAADGSQGGYYRVELNYDLCIDQVAELTVAMSKGGMVNVQPDKNKRTDGVEDPVGKHYSPCKWVGSAVPRSGT